MLKFQIVHFVLDAHFLGFRSARVLMLEIALIAVLLKVLLFGLAAQHAAELVDREIEFTVKVSPFDAEVAPD